MANKNFVVHNGLEVGSVKIFAGNGDIVSSGNISSTSSGSTNTVAVTKYLMQFPVALASPSWYYLGRFSAISGAGTGESIEITVVAGSGYASESLARDVIQARILNGSGTNIQANYYSSGGYRQAVGGVKLKSVNAVATDTAWDIYVLMNDDLGRGFAEVKVTNDAIFNWVNTTTVDPGSASSTLVVATNQFVTASSNVVIQTGNLYVGGNIYQAGSQVSTSTTSGFITKVINGNDSQGPFSLGNAPADSNQIAVWWNGIYQPKDTYSVNGSNITFTEAIPTGSNVEVKILAGSGISALGTLADVDFTAAPSDGQYLTYQASTGKWKAASGTSANVVTNTALTYAVVLGGF